MVVAMRRQRTRACEHLRRRCSPPGGIPRPVRLGRRTEQSPRTPPATGPSEIRHSCSVRSSTTSHHAIGAGRCEAQGVALGVLQSANLWKPDRPTFFACTFAPGAQAVGTIGDFFRKVARPASTIVRCPTASRDIPCAST